MSAAGNPKTPEGVAGGTISGVDSDSKVATLNREWPPLYACCHAG